MTLIYWTGAWLAGIAIAHWLWQLGWLTCNRPSPALWIALVGGNLAAAIGRQPRLRDTRRLMLAALFLLLGIWRYQSHPMWPCLTPDNLAYYNGDAHTRAWVTVEGMVVDDPDVRDRYTGLRVRADRITINGVRRQVTGLVLVRAGRFSEYAYGDRVRATGLLEAPPRFEDFDYRAYLARQGIRSIMPRPRVRRLARGGGSPFWHVLYEIRHHAQRNIARLLPEPEASLLTGILLGVEAGIPRDLYNAFNATATSHIIVISGFNITIIAGLLMASLHRLLGHRLATPLVLGGIATYVLLVGADAAVTRAGIMGALGVIALQLGRQSTAIISLAASALFMTALNPLTLWDIGFQLSSMATLGLILFVPPLQATAERWTIRLLGDAWTHRIVPFLNDGIIVTLAAQITTAPLVVYYFRRLSLISLLTNLLILPIQPYIMTWGGAAVLLAFVPGLRLIAQAIAYIPWLCLAYTVWVVETTARMPLASLNIGRFHPMFLGSYYIGLGVLMVAMHRGVEWRLWARRLTHHLPSKVATGILSIAAILVWIGAIQGPDGLLHVFFLDVGQGDAILIQTPSGHQVLIDGGPSPAQLAWQLGRHMPFWDRGIDIVALTHPDSDHMNGLVPLADRYQIGMVIGSPITDRSPEARPWLTTLRHHHIRREIAQRGARIHMGDGVWLDVLHPPAHLLLNTQADDNNNSLVVRLGYGHICVLLTGDAEREAELSMITSGQPLRCPILKVSHHGSAGATSPEFLAAVMPQIAIFQVGRDNPFGHPAPAVLKRLAHTRIYRTDRDGTIELITDGVHIWLRTER
ncbi:MAG: DNA internalization-related competence protein ComEC/Rec2 [Anaerolineae bacterium]|nr:DNA internalization-related competence protein ComEC/Rec2 [Anaerolineae bacterium]